MPKTQQSRRKINNYIIMEEEEVNITIESVEQKSDAYQMFWESEDNEEKSIDTKESCPLCEGRGKIEK